MGRFKVERLELRPDDCGFCPAKGVPCLVQSVYAREQGVDHVIDLRVSGAVALCVRCADRRVKSGGGDGIEQG